MAEIFFQILKNKKWVDLLISANIKTASGGRLCDARFTDAASYWFDLTAGKDLYTNPAGTFSLRAQAMAGFYCWMTNSIQNRQNDALCYGLGLQGTCHNFPMVQDSLHLIETLNCLPIYRAFMGMKTTETDLSNFVTI